MPRRSATWSGLVGLLIGLALAMAASGPTAAAELSETTLRALQRADVIHEAYRSPSRIEERTFWSPTLRRTMPYFVYVPPGYENDDRRYSVIYMLHGMGGSNTEWKGYNFIGTADNLIKDGLLPPMLIVLPQGDQSYWVDHPGDGPRWGQYTAEDVVDVIDATWRTVPDRDHRAIGGLSMGAHGALQLAMRYPDVFGTVGAHSPTLRDYESALEWLGPSFVGDPGFFREHDPVSLIADHPETARRLRIWIDVGQDDANWNQIVTDFHKLLVARDVPHEWQVLPGGHNGDEYWGPHSAEYLRFYASAVAQPARDWTGLASLVDRSPANRPG